MVNASRARELREPTVRRASRRPQSRQRPRAVAVSSPTAGAPCRPRISPSAATVDAPLTQEHTGRPLVGPRELFDSGNAPAPRPLSRRVAGVPCRPRLASSSRRLTLRRLESAARRLFVGPCDPTDAGRAPAPGTLSSLPAGVPCRPRRASSAATVKAPLAREPPEAPVRRTPRRRRSRPSPHAVALREISHAEPRHCRNRRMHSSDPRGRRRKSPRPEERAAQKSSQALRSFSTLLAIFHARLKMLIVDNAAAGHYVEAASPRSLPAGGTFPKVENTFPTELRILGVVNK